MLHHPTPDAELLGARLPPGFLLGTATASAQIEGATTQGRRSPSVWDDFSSQPGRIADSSTTAVTADHYHRLSEDIARVC